MINFSFAFCFKYKSDCLWLNYFSFQPSNCRTRLYPCPNLKFAKKMYLTIHNSTACYYSGLYSIMINFGIPNGFVFKEQKIFSIISVLTRSRAAVTGYFDKEILKSYFMSLIFSRKILFIAGPFQWDPILIKPILQILFYFFLFVRLN